MAEDLYVAVFCFLISLAGAVVAFVLSHRMQVAAAAKAAELSGRIDAAYAESEAMTQSIQAAKAGLEKKITRNAMQSITKQARDLTSAVIEGS